MNPFKLHCLRPFDIEWPRSDRIGQGIALFFEPTIFPWLKPIQKEWVTCLREFDQIPRDLLVVWPEPLLDSGGWLVYGLFGLGKRIEENCERCPETARLLESIPDCYIAAFSVLQARTRIRPHYGYTADVLRAHLGLRIPSDCGIRVGDDIRQWKAGEWIVFDDTQRHEAWNMSSEDRVVLLVDFLRRDVMSSINREK